VVQLSLSFQFLAHNFADALILSGSSQTFLFRPCSAQSQPSKYTTSDSLRTIYLQTHARTSSFSSSLLLPTNRPRLFGTQQSNHNAVFQLPNTKRKNYGKALQDQAFNMTQSQNAFLRESTSTICWDSDALECGYGRWILC